MKHQRLETLPQLIQRVRARRVSRIGMAVAQSLLLCLRAGISTGHAEDALNDDQGAEVLTRGPVHEAFAGIVSYNPEPGVIVDKAPPGAIEERPPEIRPAGENISWIPGYWSWDDERSDYLWISGTWRALPPGRRWTAGYWTSAGQGYQWISGYWGDSLVEETTYLPKPPVTVEAGPNVEAPSQDHTWTPGSWKWSEDRYVWRPGYWGEGRSEWDWIPAHYVWTPRGYVFVDGYWDYNVERRGVLYAPVHFQPGYYSRPGYSYSPVIAIGLLAMIEHLFLRPDYHHYYFGDYYDRRYQNRGYYSPYAFQSSHRGFDPVYSQRRWMQRQDRDWERRYQESYEYRRDHESARPPRTWAAQNRLRLDSAEAKGQRLIMAARLDQMAKQADAPLRIQEVPGKERLKFARLTREVGKAREQRRVLETEGVDIAGQGTGRQVKPTKVRLPASPIAGVPADRLPKKQAPPKPREDPVAGPGKEAPGRNPAPDKAWPQPKVNPEPRQPEPGKEQPAPSRTPVPKKQKQPPQPSRPADQAPAGKPTLKPREPAQDSSEKSRQPAKDGPAKAKDEPSEKDTGKHNQGTGKPSSGRKSEPGRENPEQATGKDRKNKGK
jgi:hypothetical protein